MTEKKNIREKQEGQKMEMMNNEWKKKAGIWLFISSQILVFFSMAAVAVTLIVENQVDECLIKTILIFQAYVFTIVWGSTASVNIREIVSQFLSIAQKNHANNSLPHR